MGMSLANNLEREFTLGENFNISSRSDFQVRRLFGSSMQFRLGCSFICVCVGVADGILEFSGV